MLTVSRLSLVAFSSSMLRAADFASAFLHQNGLCRGSLSAQRASPSGEQKGQSIVATTQRGEEYDMMASNLALQGVVFDMDGTLTKPNLDFKLMYQRCGVDPSLDILEEIEAMSTNERNKALDIIEEIEEEGRRTLELMPGAIQLLTWLSSNEIPMALVTRNTERTANVFLEKLVPPECQFQNIITRDNYCNSIVPPKPDPRALEVIADEWEIRLPSKSIVMVGDSYDNDIVFGKNAGVTTVLLDTNKRYYTSSNDQNTTDSGDTNIQNAPISSSRPDLVINHLSVLPDQLGSLFAI